MTAVTLDGYPVSLNQTLFDVAYGTGIVTFVNPTSNNFNVDFGVPGRTMVYGGDTSVPGGLGGRFSYRTLYWQNPVVVAPPPTSVTNRSGLTWTSLVVILQAAYSALLG